MRLSLCAIAATCTLSLGDTALGGEPETRHFRGVVTLHLIPAKVMRINRIIEDPEPGTSYIGDEGILVELDENVEVRANWTVVDVEYREYPQPREIAYELFGEEHRLTVRYRAVNVELDGDISQHIPQR